MGSDATRVALAGARLIRRCAVCIFKGDWAEYATTCGLAARNDSVRACFGCNTPLSKLHEKTAPISASDAPYRENREGEYEEAAARCAKIVVISDQTHTRLVGMLWCAKRQSGAHGRVVGTPGIPSLEMLPGMWLEPCPQLQDV